jgi:predicted RNase H-like nuclease (RuvC/YqgF family)
MKKISLLLSVATLAFLSSCTDTKQITDLQDQARRLEAQVQKERQENAELSSYRFSMESQFKRKNEDYVKCQEDGKDNFESLSKRYGELNTDYDKLQAAYKSLNDANDASREASTRVIVDLEERIKQMRVVGDAGAVVAVSGTSNPTYTSGPTYAPNGTVIKAKRKKRRR